MFSGYSIYNNYKGKMVTSLTQFLCPSFGSESNFGFRKPRSQPLDLVILYFGGRIYNL